MKKLGKWFKDFLVNTRMLSYRAKMLRMVEYPNITNMVRSARNSGMFKGVPAGTLTESGKKSVFVVPENGFECFYGKDENVTERITMSTYYIFCDNICIMSQRSGDDIIVRIRLKDPETSWRIERTTVDGEEHIEFFPKGCQYLEIYAWWSVDWLGMGQRDTNTGYISGSWDKVVYTTVKKVFDTVHMGSDASLFDSKYVKFES